MTVKAPDPSAKAVDRFPPVGIRQEALAAMAAQVAGKEKSDSRARMAVRLDTFSRVMNKSDTTGAVEFCSAVHVLVVLVAARQPSYPITRSFAVMVLLLHLSHPKLPLQ